MENRQQECTLRLVRTSGFTLLEMIITVAIAAIVVTIVVPSFSQLMAGTRITTAINELVTTYNFARIEAIKRRTQVAICPSLDGAACLKQAVWEHGWIVFVDLDEDEDRDAEEEVLRANQGFGSQLTIRSGSRTYMALRPTGMARGGLAGTYTFCDPGDAAPPKAILVSNPGRPRVSSTKSDGTALQCP